MRQFILLIQVDANVSGKPPSGDLRAILPRPGPDHPLGGNDNAAVDRNPGTGDASTCTGCCDPSFRGGQYPGQFLLRFRIVNRIDATCIGGEGIALIRKIPVYCFGVVLDIHHLGESGDVI
jgi:hypothetical protein